MSLSMGRKRTSRLDLPERVYFHHQAYYYVHRSGKWEKLDTDYVKAMAIWATRIAEQCAEVVTVGDLLNRYIVEVVPTKAERTQTDNLHEIRYLRAFFGEMSCADVEAKHVAAYLDARAAKTRGNREVALLSHAFNKAILWGLVKHNPCAVPGMRNREAPRDRYVTDEEVAKFKALCLDWMKTYIDIKSLTGLRQQDLLALQWSDITEEGIAVCPIKTQTSTRKKMLISMTPELSSLLQSLTKSGPYCFTTRLNHPYTASGFQSIWKRVMTKFVAAGGARFHEHDLRGKVATDMDDPVAAQKLLGHKDMSMTEDYIKARQTEVVKPHTRRKKE